MPRFLTQEWVDAFNDALADVAWPSEPTEGSLAAASGRFSVSQVVHDVPPGGGSVRTTLVMDGGRLHLHFDGPDEADPRGQPDVTIALDYPDAAALSRGEVGPAEVLNSGRVRVRGDLAVLVAGQALLAEAAGALAGLRAATSY